jgi:site-specific recombinase XerD
MTRGRKRYGCYDDERAVIEVIYLKARRRKGADLPPGPWVIARELNKERYPAPGGGSWHGITVKRILARKDEPPAEAGPKKKTVRKEDLSATDYLTARQIEKCRRVVSGTDLVIFETMLGSGLRAAELCALQIGDLGLYGDKKQIDVKRGKGAKSRKILIGDDLFKMLENYYVHRAKKYFEQEDLPAKYHSLFLNIRSHALEYRDVYCLVQPLFINKRGLALKYNDLYYLIRQIGKKAGIPGLHPHVLRHTFAVHLYNYKHDLEFVREQLGHASIATTQIYAKTLSDSKLEQMKGFEASLKI